MPRVRPRTARTLRRLLVCAVVAVLLLVATGVALNLRLVSGLNRVDGVFDDVGDRPDRGAGTTFLLLGTVAAGDSTAPEVPWLRAGRALESVMLVHVLDDRRHVTVDSFELDPSLAAEVTAADPSRAVGAVEARSGQRVDHLLVVDWVALQQLADDNGIAATYLPGSSVHRQQSFLRAVLEDTLHAELRKEPWNLYSALHTVTRGMVVEDGWSVISMDLLVVSLRDLRSADIEFRSAETSPPDRAPILANAGGGMSARVPAPPLL